MIKYLKLKKQKLLLETAIIGKIYSLVDSIPDLSEFATKAKDLDGTDLQKLIAEELVKYIKVNETKSE